MAVGRAVPYVALWPSLRSTSAAILKAHIEHIPARAVPCINVYWSMHSYHRLGALLCSLHKAVAQNSTLRAASRVLQSMSAAVSQGSWARTQSYPLTGLATTLQFDTHTTAKLGALYWRKFI